MPRDKKIEALRKKFGSYGEVLRRELERTQDEPIKRYDYTYSAPKRKLKAGEFEVLITKGEEKPNEDSRRTQAD